MEIQKNSRQIPDNMKYTASKNYCDLLYGYLQEKSFKDVDNQRYIAKKDICFVQIAKDLKKNRQTIAKYFNNLLDMGLLVDTGDYYQLQLLDKSISTLVPFETLRILNNTLHPRCISIYVYLFNRYYANKEKPYLVTISQLKAFVGLSTKTRSNDDIIDDILMILQKLGLISYQLTQSEETKTNIQINMVTNVIS